MQAVLGLHSQHALLLFTRYLFVYLFIIGTFRFPLSGPFYTQTSCFTNLPSASTKGVSP